ncbi:UDP-3-O-acyl-N-acetylglucosamine deacetylase [Sediminicoccus sp. KRV36]|nr:UDP-3-O-acyl-N-acetylglucosamine deacetylase [Sediminicoccus rosea]UPY39297.1 UDP-3-O-acyl-N-acetylglucosamine deacetylase [Sediminicoccus rosea]
MGYGVPGYGTLGSALVRRRLASSISCRGVGLHSGRTISLTLHPGPIGSGIIFHRSDLGLDIPAQHDLVVETRLCTQIGLPGDRAARVGTIEHVMAALAAAGIDDAVVELDGPEVPILDGSAAPFLFLIDCAGTAEHFAPRRIIEVLRHVRVEDSNGAFAELAPNTEFAFDAALTIDFGETAIGRQSLSLRVSVESFRRELADARTFTLAEDVARLRAAGLAQGGSLANAVVVDGPMILNPGGLRRPDEFVRHKLLDVVGDLALAGAPIAGRFSGHRSGHALNNELLRALFSDRANWRAVGNHAMADTSKLVAA